jgi:hypothetical protein
MGAGALGDVITVFIGMKVIDTLYIPSRSQYELVSDPIIKSVY